MTFFVNFLLGLLFGGGLIVSGMANPQKVLNFLDLFGTWDPSLAFVMGGAVLVAFIGYRLVLRRPQPVAASRFHLPESNSIDASLVLGAGIFGLGWGLGGFCPGPALTALSLAQFGTLVFLPAMLVGMWLARMFKAGVSAGPPRLA